MMTFDEWYIDWWPDEPGYCSESDYKEWAFHAFVAAGGDVDTDDPE